MRFKYCLLVACGIIVASITDFADAKYDTPTVTSTKSTKENDVTITKAGKTQGYGKPTDQGDSTEERALIRPAMKEALKNFWKKPKLFLQQLKAMRKMHG
ncbi:hypothetical protein PHMEG_00041861 [Phytophthora megakarya]|uniref:RxLR effector protein n=1 Tax=Phytophthora megakarya TaxID=4795 RepID=A0A225UAL7_9STRA|nr:hypothetical protein PHMEG_00041861 [Phytophthora megakarya]